MLREFFNEWKEAQKTGHVVNQEWNESKTTVIREEISLTFRNTEIIMCCYLTPDDVNKPVDKQYWLSELHCPATGKFLRNNKMNLSKCAASILDLITLGDSYANANNARVEQRKQLLNDRLIKQHRTRFNGTVYTPQEIEIIIEDVKTRLNGGNLSWDIHAVNMLAEFDKVITGRNLGTIGIHLVNEEKYHVHRMYDIAAILIQRSSKDSWNNTVIPSIVAKQEFLFPPRDTWPKGICVVRNIYTNLYNKSDTVAKFMHLVKIMAKLYQHMIGENIDVRADKVRSRRENRRARAAEIRRVEGYVPTSTAKVAPISMRNYAPTMDTSIGSVFGNILDEALNNITNTSNGKKKKKSKKQSSEQ